MNVSELARTTGVSGYRLRHYEKLGLIKATRSPAGYRLFAPTAVREVIFIAKCRDVGVSLKEIGGVLPAYRVGTLTFDDMIELMAEQIVQVDKQLSELIEVRKELNSALNWFRRKKREQKQRKHRAAASQPIKRASRCQIQEP